MRPTFENFLKKLDNAHAQSLILDNTLTGIEKENLRVNLSAHIAQTSHPIALGSTLTHPYITTDYSESLLEMVTPPIQDRDALLSWLEHLHTYIYSHLDNELLWSPSMPCIIPTDDDVPIAQYGSSHQGWMRTLYRIGLGHRYEKKMQTIAGIHFNYSLPQTFWQIWHDLFSKEANLQTTINERYFGIARNYLRYGWLIDYLFGASPVFDASFLTHQVPTGLMSFKKHTLYAPYACSLRMSDLGYHNATQKKLNISFNSVSEYAQGLKHAISTPYLPYQVLFEKFGKDAQINANLLQIEAEYYAHIRPKRVLAKSERQSQALLQQGVEYLEVRAIDINPYEPLGINALQIDFTRLFLLYCLLSDSPPFTDEEQASIAYNTQTVVFSGRKPGCVLHAKDNKPILLTDWARSIFSELEEIAGFLDKGTFDKRYQHALNHFKEKVEHPELLPSAQMLEDLFQHYDSFSDLGLALSQKNKAYFADKKLSTLEYADLDQVARESIQQQRMIEAQQTGTFEEFLAGYFK
ncbi:MAG: glutamate--cysteine ligase [Gammaproteobacteria bacterium]